MVLSQNNNDMVNFETSPLINVRVKENESNGHNKISMTKLEHEEKIKSSIEIYKQPCITEKNIIEVEKATFCPLIFSYAHSIKSHAEVGFQDQR